MRVKTTKRVAIAPLASPKAGNSFERTSSRAVTALADALRRRAPGLAWLEPDLDGRVDGLVWAEAAFSIDPGADAAALGELVRAIAPGTLNPDGAPRRTETWATFGKNLRAVVPGVRRIRPRDRNDGDREYPLCRHPATEAG